MKIRNGFVSNSSSTSFVVCCPPNIEITDEEIKDALGNVLCDMDEEKGKNLIKGVREFFSNEFEIVNEYRFNLFFPIAEILQYKKLVLISNSVGSDSGSIINIYGHVDRINQITSNINH